MRHTISTSSTTQAAPWTDGNYRHYLAAYYHYLARVDAEIGLILDVLEARADAESTIIVFMADHGDGMASHRMVTKQVSFIEETTHVPFMIAEPQEYVAGSRTIDSPISLLNLVSDPGETRTLIHDYDHAAALAAHRALLDEHLRATQDPFLSLSCETESRWRSHTPGYQNHRGPAAPMVGEES